MEHSLVFGLDGGGVTEYQHCVLVSVESGLSTSQVSPSATNSLYTFGGVSSLGNTTMPFLTSFRLTRLSANEADCPAEQTDTGILFRSIDLIWVVVN